jgi:putative transposase
VRELSELDGPTRTEALRRFALLQAHLEQGAPLPSVARDAQVPLRTARRWVERYRADGLAGLARQGRADRGARRAIADDARKLVEGLALQQPPLSVAAIHRELLNWARASGQAVASHDTVSRVITAITRGC